MNNKHKSKKSSPKRRFTERFRKFAVIVGLVSQLSFVSPNRYFVCNRTPVNELKDAITYLINGEGNKLYTAPFENAVKAAMNSDFDKRNEALCKIEFNKSALKHVVKNSRYPDTKKKARVLLKKNQGKFINH